MTEISHEESLRRKKMANGLGSYEEILAAFRDESVPAQDRPSAECLKTAMYRRNAEQAKHAEAMKQSTPGPKLPGVLRNPNARW